MNVEDLIGVLSMLPESWRPWVLLALQVMPIVAAVLAVVKTKLGVPDPERDSWGRTLAFWALSALDWLALNSTPVREKLRQQENERAKRRMSMPPMLLLVLPVLMLSCAATPLETHATIAASSADVIDAAGAQLQARLEAVERDAVATSATQEEARARVDRLRATYAPLEAAYEAVRLAHAAYVDSILRAHAAGRERPEPDVIGALSSAWVELVKRAEMLGLVLPAAPPALRGLLPGGDL